MYTASVQQIGLYLRTKNEGKEVGARTNKNTYLKSKSEQTKKEQVHKTNNKKTYNKHISSTKSILIDVLPTETSNQLIILIEYVKP